MCFAGPLGCASQRICFTEATEAPAFARAAKPAPSVQSPMRRTAWIWLAGCLAWTLDTLVSVHYGNQKHAVIALCMALLFGIAWLFYRNQQR